MTIIQSPLELPSGWMRMYCLSDRDEAEKVAQGQAGYLMQSNIVDAFYLFIPVEA